MTEIILTAKEEAGKLKENTPQGAHIKTGDVRRLSAKLYKSISDKSAENIFNICTALLEEHSWEMGVIAFDWAYRARKYCSDTTCYSYNSFEKTVCKGCFLWICSSLLKNAFSVAAFSEISESGKE